MLKAIAAGNDFTLALKNDGTVAAWGRNDFGQVAVPFGLTGVVAITAGVRHAVALKNDGAVVAWGRYNEGQTAVPLAARSGVVAIAAGWGHTVALKTDGTAVTWGHNDEGQATVPIAVQSSVLAIAARGNNTAAVVGTLLPREPIVITQPISQTVLVGSSVTLATTATGAPPLGYQWWFNRRKLRSETNSNLVLSNIRLRARGNYQVEVANGLGVVRSALARVNVVVGPKIVSKPRTITARTGKRVTFRVAATGSKPLVYQWLKDGATIEDSTNRVFRIASVQLDDAGAYSVRVSNAGAFQESLFAELIVVP